MTGKMARKSRMIYVIKSHQIFLTKFSKGRNWLLDWWMSVGRAALGGGRIFFSERNSLLISQRISMKLSQSDCHQVPWRLLSGF